MMDGFTPEYTISQTLKVGVIYKLKAPDLINTDIPHHFIIAAIDDDDNYMCLCTSQEGRQLSYFIRNDLNFDTLANIEPNETNGLTKRTYVNCNDSYEISKLRLVEMCKSGTLSLTGNLSLDEYSIVRDSINRSETSDIPKMLLVHPDEIE